MISVILLAAGSGLRYSKEDNKPKQFILFNGKKLYLNAVESFINSGFINHIVIVTKKEFISDVQQDLSSLQYRHLADKYSIISGGETRAQSAFLGLQHLASLQPQTDIVLIHDAARPLIPTNIIKNLIDEIKIYEGAVPSLKIVDTIKQIDENGTIKTTLNRDSLRIIQTPQALRFNTALDCFSKVNLLDSQFTDDVSILEYFGHKIKTIQGDDSMLKITHLGDIEQLETLLKTKDSLDNGL